MASFETTRRLVNALDAARTFGRQSAGLLAMVVACSAWILSVPQAPEPFPWLLLGVAACADELILTGFACESTRTPVERAIARRAAWLERPRTRHRLAEHLRWRLQLAEGSLGVSPGYLRASVHPPLAGYERRVLLAYGLPAESSAATSRRRPRRPRRTSWWGLARVARQLRPDAGRREGAADP